MGRGELAGRAAEVARGVTVRADRVGLSRGGTRILDDITLVATSGSALAITGPSGSGKSTLLTVLAGLERPDTGTVRHDGVEIGPRRRPPGRVGVVHQAFALLGVLTAAENVELALQAQGLHGRRVRSLAAARLAEVGLAGRGDHLAEELSGGEQQRVALARALVVGPDLLLADEPTAQLDPDSRAVVLEVLGAAAAAGATVVVATHDEEVASSCDRVARLASGRLRPES